MSLTLDILDGNQFHMTGLEASRYRIHRQPYGSFRDNNPLNAVKSMINKAPEAAQVNTITVDASPANSHTFTVVIAGARSVSYTSDSSATQTEVTAGLLAALNNDGVASGAATWAITSSGVITGTGRTPGAEYTLTTSDSYLTIATVTAAAAAATIPFGRALMAISDSYSNGSQACALLSSDYLVAMVRTVTCVYAASENYFVSIAVDGLEFTTTAVVANTDSATTATDIATAINAMMPTYTVIAAATSGGALTLTAEVKGKPFTASVWAKVNNAKISIADTTVGRQTNIYQCFAGFSMIADNITGTLTDPDETGAVAYKSNAGVRVATRATGGFMVENSEAPTDASYVYLETTPASAGKVYASPSAATRIKVDPALLPLSWIGDVDSNFTNDGTAILKIGR